MKHHLLDRPVWNALNGRQAHVAVGGDGARRFLPNIGPLASACDDKGVSLAQLAALIPPDDTLLLLQSDDIVLAPDVEVVARALGVQMVLERLNAPAPVAAHIENLTIVDIPAMLALANLTKPGPFKDGTSQLGDFIGIKENGVLVAMAGERMKHEGYTEISGVCSHPDLRGRGFASALTVIAAKRILERGETPYLHTYAANAAAIKLYVRLGFRIRREMQIAVIAKAPKSSESPAQ